jgi:chromosome segregation ATPase
VSALASTVALPESWGAVGRAVSAFRAEFVGFEHDIAHVLDDLEALRGQLDTRTREIEQQKRRFAEREAVFEQQRSDSGRLSLQLEHREAELASARQELATAKQELTIARQELAESQQAAQARVVAPGSEDARLVELQAELEQALLELELVRGHAAELQETVSEQKQELSQQRSSMGDELKELRRLVEQQADLLSAQPHDVAASALAAPAPVAKDAAAAGPAADPVVSSVMAQFAKLQQDVTQRRKSRK